MSQIETGDAVRLENMLGGKNASAIDFWNGRALVVSDEVTKEKGNLVQVFEPDGGDFRAVEGAAVALDARGAPVEEMDLEGLAVEGDTVFVVGSHSARRKRTDPEKTHAKNLAAVMGAPEAQPARDVLFRFTFDAAGKAGEVERSGLRQFLNSTEPFRSFHDIAGKENGVDIEGLAIRDGRLFVGFRGPVLRGNFTPVLRCRFGSPISEAEVRFVNLGGRGVRDLAAAEDGLLILAGPVGDGPGSFQLYLWDGRDQVPGMDAPTSPGDPGLELIGDLPMPPGSNAASPAKAEGLALVEETNKHWELMLVFDGLKDGHATRYRVKKP
jgi:hypothetical protein